MSKDDLRNYLTQLNKTAQMIENCKLCVCSFGQDIYATQKFFIAGDIEGMMSEIEALSHEVGRNIYVPLAIFGENATTRDKANQIGILGFVMDFDDGNASLYPERLPVPPDFVLETSKGRFQAYFMLSEPLMDLEKAGAIAQSLTKVSGADHCSKDVTHPWRLPDTVNYPNRKKISQGRNPNGEAVKIKEFLEDKCTSIEVLIAAVGGIRETSTEGEKQRVLLSDSESLADRANHVLYQLPSFILENLEDPASERDRSGHIYNTLALLHENGVAIDDAYAVSIKFQEGFMSKHQGKSDEIRKEVERVYADKDFTSSVSTITSPPMLASVSSTVFKPISELMKLPKPEYLIEGILPKSGVFGLTGAAGLGKSLLALDMMLSIATGVPWAGKLTKQEKVLYLCMEGLWGLRPRLEAWQKHRGVIVDPDYFFFGQGEFLLDTKEGLASFRKNLEAARAEYGDFSLVVVDTLSRTISGDDNDAGVMIPYTTGIGSIVNEFGCSVMIVHHPSKSGEDKGRVNVFRGHSSLYAALDVGFSLKPLGGNIILTCEKIKDNEEPNPLVFEKVGIDLEAELGTRDDGRPFTSVVLDPVGMLTGSAGVSKSKKIKASKYEDFRALILKMLDETPVISHKEARDEYFKDKGLIRKATMDSATTRAFDDLITEGKVIAKDKRMYIKAVPAAATYTINPVYYPVYH